MDKALARPAINFLTSNSLPPAFTIIPATNKESKSIEICKELKEDNKEYL
ncbi:hypothetical protein Fmac_028061 [Flemingia macrophylla]|uniref:Uncharacterized protein n=1 Tax=Flemingia macrophylla TaxID=520843 RepID=A0ABD1LJH7_9FABA